MADEYAKAAVIGSAPDEEVPEGYREVTSLSHMTRVATEARYRETAEWIAKNVRAGRRHRPSSGRGLRRPAPPCKRDPSRPLLPASGWPRGNRVPLAMSQKGGHERVLVVRQQRAPVAASSLHTVPGVSPIGQKDVEVDMEGV